MQKTTIWITGSSGRVGTALEKALSGLLDIRLIATDTDVDVTDLSAVEKAMGIFQPSIVINCAGLSDADYCEANPIDAYRVNALGPRNLAAASRVRNATIIHLSSDDVFSGEHNTAKTEFDTPTPRTVYGKSKLAGENFVRELNPKHLILRSSWVYGFEKSQEKGCSNFYEEVLEHGKKGENFDVPIDMIGSPTSTREITKFVMCLLKTHEYGIFHVSCEGACTRLDYARAILELNGYNPHLAQGILSSKDGTLVATQLDNMMMKMTRLYEMPPWYDAMKEFVETTKEGR